MCFCNFCDTLGKNTSPQVAGAQEDLPGLGKIKRGLGMLPTGLVTNPTGLVTLTIGLENYLISICPTALESVQLHWNLSNYIGILLGSLIGASKRYNF